MEIGTVTVKLQIIEITPLCEVGFKGRLLTAIPTELKPKSVTSKTWATSILAATAQHGKFQLALPKSFWQEKWGEVDIEAGIGGVRCIDVIDVITVTDYSCGSTPMQSVLEIIEVLKNGADVLIPASTQKISGFVPALLNLISHDSHPVKVWNPIVCGDKYELTPFQLGYIYGIYDGRSAFGLEYIRREINR